MEETTLYRKYRPATFKEVVGQSEVIKVLENAIKSHKIPHAWLFSGSRGIGKTSIARIFAKELKITPADLYEIDGASNNGVDHIRELRENVTALPYESPYKMYIIDEAHMLSTSAFNALLKTLEEPPAHVMFVMATTEEHKFPETILSRVQTLSFKRPLVSDIKVLIERTAKAEGIDIEEGAVELLAMSADGAYRNALGLLQKAQTVFGEDTKVTTAGVAKLLGAPQSALIFELLEAITKKDTDKALVTIGEIFKDTIDASVLLHMLLERVRALMIFRLAPDSVHDLVTGISSEELETLKSLTKKTELPITSKVLRRFLEIDRDLAFVTNAKVAFEVAVVDCLESQQGN